MTDSIIQVHQEAQPFKAQYSVAVDEIIDPKETASCPETDDNRAEIPSPYTVSGGGSPPRRPNSLQLLNSHEISDLTISATNAEPPSDVANYPQAPIVHIGLHGAGHKGPKMSASEYNAMEIQYGYQAHYVGRLSDRSSSESGGFQGSSGGEAQVTVTDLNNMAGNDPNNLLDLRELSSGEEWICVSWITAIYSSMYTV
jgi:hypothetical protein